MPGEDPPAEIEALRFFNEPASQKTVSRFLRGLPTAKDRSQFVEQAAWHVEQGHPLTAELLAAAVANAERFCAESSRRPSMTQIVVGLRDAAAEFGRRRRERERETRPPQPADGPPPGWSFTGGPVRTEEERAVRRERAMAIMRAARADPAAAREALRAAH